MPAPDDFTVTLLHAIQNERTTPQGGWLNVREMARGMGLTAAESRHLTGPLTELMDAGMIERRFNAAKAVDEYRSRGVQPAMGHDYGDAKGPNLRAPRPDRNTPAREDDAVVEEHMARRVLTVLLEAVPGEWYRDADLLTMLGTDDLGTLWSGLNLLEAAGLIQRRPDHKAVRAHMDLARAIR